MNRDDRLTMLLVGVLLVCLILVSLYLWSLDAEQLILEEF